jgi:hypothetical protein
MKAEDDEKIHVLTKAAEGVVRKYPFRQLTAAPPLKHRFERWGITTSSLLLEQLEELGWTLSKKEEA